MARTKGSKNRGGPRRGRYVPKNTPKPTQEVLEERHLTFLESARSLHYQQFLDEGDNNGVVFIQRGDNRGFHNLGDGCRHVQPKRNNS